MNPARHDSATPNQPLREGPRARADQLYRATHGRLRQVRACTLQVVSDAQEVDRVRRLGDEELIRLAARLDPVAFEVLFQRHSVVAFSLAVRIVGSGDQAQDVVREAFLILWRDAGRYDPKRGTVRRWLMIIVHDRSIDAVRRLSRRDRLRPDATSLPLPEAVDLAAGSAREQTPAIREALETLPEDQRRIVELAFYEGWMQAEIADMLELPLSTVKTRARLGLLKLRDALLSQLPAPP
jgi:RNA polymerase sigma-70 factor (ECF subfamily)